MKKYLSDFLVVIVLFAGLGLVGQQQPQNPGFEFWEEFGFGPDTLEPVDWNSLKSSDGGDFINEVIPVVWERSTDAHSGMYSVKLFNEDILGLVAPGTLTNGRVHATLPPSDAYVYTIDSLPEFNTPFTDLPDSLTLWVKYFPVDGDIARITAILHADTAKIPDSLQTNWIAFAKIDIADEVSDWTRFSVPFEYLTNETPEHILFAIFAGDAENALVGSVLFVDDIELIYYNTGISETGQEGFRIQMYGDYMKIILNEKHCQDTYTVRVFDLSGKIVKSIQVRYSEADQIRVDFPPGIYLCKVQSTTHTFTQKIIKK